MHACELVELSGLVAVQGAVFIRQRGTVSESGIRDYWAASKCRLDRWAHALRAYCDAVDGVDGGERTTLWRSVRPVLEEILASEILTRVWTAAGCGFDRSRGAADIEPIVRSVYVGHLEARNRALNLIVYGRGFGMHEAVALNRLRRRSERWTDMLLGYLHADYDTAEFAFDADRAADFADDLRHDEAALQAESSSRLMLASLRAAFVRQLHARSVCGELNRRIAAGVLACLDAELFDATGLFKSLWLARLDAAANDTQVMIDELFALEKGVFASSDSERPARDGDRHMPRF